MYYRLAMDRALGNDFTVRLYACPTCHKVLAREDAGRSAPSLTVLDHAELEAGKVCCLRCSCGDKVFLEGR